MTRLEKPPQWKDVFKDDAAPFIKLLGDPDVTQFVNRMNDKYYYWDEIKYRPHPDTITPAMGWFFVKVSRISQKKTLGLFSKTGEAFGYWLPDCILKELHFIDQNATGQMLVDDPTVGTIDRDRLFDTSA